MKQSILVIGLGNLLASDEGVGVHFIRELRQEFHPSGGIELIDGGTLGFELLERLETCDILIIIDAVNANEPPGTVITLEDEEIPAYFEMKVSPHQQSFQEVLAYSKARGTFPKRVILIGVQPDSTETGVELTPVVQDCLPTVKQQFYACIKPFLKPGKLMQENTVQTD